MHRFDHLYRIICRQEWIAAALIGVLANKGARTPGIDGMTKADLATDSARSAFNIWLGNAENNERWREIKAQAKAERGARCERCGSTVNLDLHHRKAKRYGGEDTIENAELLCKPCHVQTSSYGDHSRLQ